ncbi:MAG: aldehyde ferredoxin oxidoreductase family protein [Deltaproteobacteria bacterium]|jgi:aldehyde:ferredoxin oxidoreductase|nr:aldehyde ferredoxin oxidoreductase family protein [Deltaproteobacteria bacterium]MBT4268039.1 aldehyde ferredoxin oxidoreductase family protein [Deltaproteobacteria bacterium]MBT4641493.1 aldehyde ferredoxin oxidoreductase family protein [Deltaproteobacteria bacterium]MBT6503561.1 aldehyde ferredoxin oxidoreductase family protein [Deltaproteobacteria bacterium]MBT7152877.1 aldehyde ferredoxin oxidoreductase family protein [Deltaproteobacteria bacterium]
MPNGYQGLILRVDLTTKKIEKKEISDAFYRTYMGGGAIGAYFLLKETTGNMDAFDSANIITIAPSVTTGTTVSGVSRCSVISLSPLTGAVGEGQAGGSIGPMIKRAGIDAIVVTGQSEKPCYLYVSSEDIEIRDASELWGRTVGEAHDILVDSLGKAKLSIIQCGPAGEKKVRFASLMVDRNNVVGRTGLGAVFGSKNLRAIAVRGDGSLNFAQPDELKLFNKLAKERLEKAGFPTILKNSGTAGVFAIQAKSGNIATHNFSRSFHEEFINLDAETIDPILSSGKTTCFGCIVACRKRVSATRPYQISDKLGGPEFETLSLLGSNLDIMDAAAVSKANEMCNQFGLDTITTGAIASYIMESMEKGAIGPEQNQGKKVQFGSPEDLFDLIRQIVNREGIGDIIADGFVNAISVFGKDTEPFAIHAKGQGLPAHMAQVKPSQALMYAACPIGGDHMSAEHDFFLNENDDDCRGLGIFGSGDASSTNLAKARMTAYSQHYYSLLDTLTLCMFVWGPGSLFTYRDLEDLLYHTTGWKCTFWELMKVGERKTNMLKQINAKRGFSKADDVLPERLYQPLPDGPAKGKCVDRDLFPEMLDHYYNLMGWDKETGNPSTSKLVELGLDWAL